MHPRWLFSSLPSLPSRGCISLLEACPGVDNAHLPATSFPIPLQYLSLFRHVGLRVFPHITVRHSRAEHSSREHLAPLG